MKNLLWIWPFLLVVGVTNAQNVVELKEDTPAENKGIEYSYTIRNERTEDTYSRYEVTVMATNKSGCMLIYLKRENDDTRSIFEGDLSAIARFECVNATGRRLTSKGANVRARPFTVPYTVNGSTIQVEGGYLLRNGTSVSADIIVIVPKGERPKFKVRIQDFAELTGS